MIIFFKRGNALAMILMFTTAAALGTMFYLIEESPSNGFGQEEEILFETELMIEKTIEKTVKDIMLNGYSNELDVWYCNTPFPPKYDEEVKNC